jgi:hypothetical protein
MFHVQPGRGEKRHRDELRAYRGCALSRFEHLTARTGTNITGSGRGQLPAWFGNANSTETRRPNPSGARSTPKPANSSKTFWTQSAWADHDAMTRFVHSDQHAAMLADMAGRVGNPSFVDSTVHQADLPLDWITARARIADTT